MPVDDTFLRFAPNICFRGKIRNIMYIPVDVTFPYIKLGFKGVQYMDKLM